LSIPCGAIAANAMCRIYSPGYSKGKPLSSRMGSIMQNPKANKGLYGILAALLLVMLAGAAYSSGGGVTQIYKQAQTPLESSKIEASLELPVKRVMVKEPYQGGAFWTTSRKDQMERFRCTTCHNGQEVTAANAAGIAHGAIELVHGSETKPLNCLTCHQKDNRDLLTTEAGVDVDMDHSYQLCGHCHFRQKKDWVGGAHGKRVEFWAGQRVVQNCTSCHDPHAPRFTKRWPVTYSTPLAK
jgi:hypothetical protein